MKVVIDAGHGGMDNGAVYNGRREKDDTLNLALEVGRILKENGIDVDYTRTTDIYDTPTQKAQIANLKGADLLISIHRNKATTPNLYNGVQSLVYNKDGIKLELANNINRQLEDLGFGNLGDYSVEARPNLAILRRSQMPAVLVEVGFIDSDKDNELWNTRFEEIAQAIANGILETIGEDINIDFRVQVGLYRDYENAWDMVERLANDGYTGYITKWNDYYAVQVGGFNTFDEALTLQRSLSNKGYNTLIVQ